jgi:hypothetical protein
MGFDVLWRGWEKDVQSRGGRRELFLCGAGGSPTPGGTSSDLLDTGYLSSPFFLLLTVY